MTFVILTGGIDLSVGSILAASAMVGDDRVADPRLGHAGHPGRRWPAGLLFGLLNGVLIAFVKLPPFIVTLGSLTAVRGIARLIGNDTTVFNPHLPFAFIGNGDVLGRALAGDHRLRGGGAVVVHPAPHGAGRAASTRSAATRRRRGCRASRSGRSCCSSTAPSGLLVGAGRRDVGGPALRGQRAAARPVLRARRDRGGDPGRHQLRRRHRLDLGHADRRADHRGADQRPDPDWASPTSGSSSSRAW